MYTIAYKNKDGRDLNGFPWIETSGHNIEAAKQHARKMVEDGYKNVKLFNFDDLDEINWSTERVTWENINKIQIDYEKSTLEEA